MCDHVVVSKLQFRDACALGAIVRAPFQGGIGLVCGVQCGGVRLCIVPTYMTWALRTLGHPLQRLRANKVVRPACQAPM